MKAANLYFINMSPVKFHLLAPVAQAQNFCHGLHIFIAY